MKKTSFFIRLNGLFLVILVVCVSSASAQNKKMWKTTATPEVRAEKAVAYWNKHLNLTTDQQGQFKSLLAEEFTKRDSISSSVKDPKARYAAMTKLRDETHSKMETVLTAEQHEKFVAMRSTAMKGKSGVQKAKKKMRSMKVAPPKANADTSGSN